MDESKISSALRFLQHPKVADAPLSQKLSFLEGKGLSSEEINEALSRSKRPGASDAQDGWDSSRALAAPPPHMLPMPMAAPEVPLWLRLLLPGSVLGGFAIAALAVHVGFRSLQASLADDSAARRLRAEQEGPGGALESLGERISDLSDALRQQMDETAELRSQLSRLSAHHEASAAVQAATAVASASAGELKGEILSLKALILGRDGGGGGAAALPSAPDGAEGRRAAAEALVGEVLEGNSRESLSNGAPFLARLISNLLLDIPRYRKFPTQNDHFKRYIEPLKGAVPLLEACGFASNGAQLEWQWGAAEGAEKAENEELLRFISDRVKALPKEKDSHAAKSPEKSPSEAKAAPEAPEKDTITALQERLKERQGREDEGRREKYPDGFADVARRVQDGEELPGIEEVPKSLSVDAERVKEQSVVEEAPEKPWAQQGAPQAAEDQPAA